MEETIQKKSKSGTWIVIGILAFVGIAYLVSPEGSSVFAKSKNLPKRTVTTTTTYNGGGGGCPMMRNFQQARAKAAPTDNTADAQTAYETVQVGHTAFALNPETVTLKAGKSYKLIITPTEDGGGCMGTMTIPRIDNNVYPIKKGEPITIIINNAKAGTYDVVCGAMGMYQGSIIIS